MILRLLLSSDNGDRATKRKKKGKRDDLKKETEEEDLFQFHSAAIPGERGEREEECPYLSCLETDLIYFPSLEIDAVARADTISSLNKNETEKNATYGKGVEI